MSHSHFQSFLFAAVLLGSVFITRERPEARPYQTLAEQIEVTSIATPRESVSEPTTSVSATVREQRPGAASVQEFPTVSAHVIFARNLESGALLAERNGDERWPIASLTKFMTATVGTESWPSGRAVAITSSAIAAEGSAGNFNPGELFAADDLIAAMLVASSNDAAEAVAESFGRQGFIDAMQVKAAALGMRDTAFFDPTGLSVLNQSTASDLEQLVRYVARAHPELLAMSAEPRVRIRELRSGTERTLATTNQFAGKPGFLGGKTGFTDEASGNLISLFERGGQRTLIILLGSDDRFGETELIYGTLAGR